MTDKGIDLAILLPNVRVRSMTNKGGAGGSGTVLFSAENKDGVFSTYILTNHHVVENNIGYEKRWSNLMKRDVKDEVLGVIQVEFFKYQYQSRAIGATTIDADIVTYDKDEDLALMKLRDEDKAPGVAKMYPLDKVNQLRLGLPVLAMGAGLGEPPVITTGILSQFNRTIDNREFWLSTAPTIFGNSGGALYLASTFEFLGVPARIAVNMSSFQADPITHLSYAIPITRIYKFLEDQLFRFIYDSKFTEAGEVAEREKRRKEEERKVAFGIVEGSAAPADEEGTDDTPPWKR